MSHWDFGRGPAAQHDAQGPAGPDDAAYPGDAPYPGNARTPGDPWAAHGGGTPDDPWSAGFGWPPDDLLAAGNGWAADGGSPADGGWPAGESWPADNGWTRDDFWPRDGGAAGPGLAGPDLADEADEEEGTSTGPYPLTYERDDATAADAAPAAPARDDDFEPWPRAPYPRQPWEPEGTAVLTDDAAAQGFAERADDFDGRRGDASWPDDAWPGRRGSGAAGHAWPGQVSGEPGGDWDYERGGGRGARRWLIPAGVVVAGAAVGVSAVLLTSGRPGGQAGQGAGRPAAPAATPRTGAGGTQASGTGAGGTGSAAPAGPAGPPLTIAQAQQVLAGYTTLNNEANAKRSDALLATVEAGSSFAIDAGLYQVQRAAGSQPFPPFSPVQATYYLPRGEPAAGPRWFVVQVANAFTSSPAKVTSAEYLLFTQSAPGGPWRDTIEPYLLSAAGAPRVALGADGLATAVRPDDAATVTVAPGQLPAATATALDSTGPGGTAGGQAAVAVPGNLADRADLRAWQAAVQGGRVSDAHAAATGADGQEFALRTADGGALVFYTDAAEITITPPAGSQLQLTIPGFYSPGQALAQARVRYLEQFAAYDPPAAGGGSPRVVASYSAITGAD